MKQPLFPRYILKIHSSDIIKNEYCLNIDIDVARKNKEVISISDGQVIRWIDSINEVDRNHAKFKYSEGIKKIRSLKKSSGNGLKIKELYEELDKLQYIPELINVIMDKPKDIDLFKDGFIINGRKYFRFIGSPNQVKKSTVMYTSIHDTLNRLVENDRNPEYKIVPAKYEAYKALTLSGSYPVTNTDRILVVDDLITHFTEDIIMLDDSEDGEPTIEYKTAEIELDESDGYGLISPEFAKKWSDDMELDYLMSGCCIRHSFTKGMVATFDFKEFAKIHNKRFIKDVWGKEHDINDIDIVLTTSMMKLWAAYDSIDDFIKKSNKNKYSFCVTKVTPKKLDEVRTLNYQFIQSYDLSDEQIKDLISPTIDEIKDILHCDVDKTLLFLKGIKVNENNIDINNNDYVKALMIDNRLINDKYVIDRINVLISKKIQDAKIGILKAKGNYAIVVGDPYALCQKIFDLDVKNEEYGLLKAGEIYHKFWLDKNVDEVVCFRAPMSCHNNIRKMKISKSEDANYWYRYCSNLIMLNCHDSFCHALNGCDKDSDILYTSNNIVLSDNYKRTPTIICVQKSAEKLIITEDMLREANKLSFGNAIGAITNRITSMFDLLPLYPPDSEENKALQYRIMCGQLMQQNEIDATKGIISKPMPKYWYTRISNPETDKDFFNNKICADKKPYFMRYIYPDINKKYTDFIKNTKHNCIFKFGCEIEELLWRVNLTEEQAEFIDNYYRYFPVNDNGCTMNRLCHMVEDEFKNYVSGIKANSTFDYSILKSGYKYSRDNYEKIEIIYKEYVKAKRACSENMKSYKISREDFSTDLKDIKEFYKKQCEITCSNSKELCDIVIDLCYTHNKSKSFAWDVCADQIIENLLEKNGNKISYITANENGNIEYDGMTFERRDYIVDNE